MDDGIRSHLVLREKRNSERGIPPQWVGAGGECRHCAPITAHQTPLLVWHVVAREILFDLRHEFDRIVSLTNTREIAGRTDHRTENYHFSGKRWRGRRESR